MQFLGEFAFLSKYKTHIVIDNENITISFEGGKDEDFEELKKSFDQLKIMNKYEDCGIKLAKVTLMNINLIRNVYSENFRGSLHLKSD